MNKIQTFQQFLATQSVQVPVWTFIFNILLSALLGFVLSKIYIKYGKSLSNRRGFSSNFILLAMTTMLIISIVKSSLALSLGLVGALSIVRFRAAIKEPEEITYLFLCIAIGLGLGADQTLITVLAFLVIIVVVAFRNYSSESNENQNLHLIVATQQPDGNIIDRIIEILKANCTEVKMKRLDETDDKMEASFLVEFKDYEQLKKCKNQLQSSDRSLQISFIDNQGIM